jgi:hypothetical protein
MTTPPANVAVPPAPGAGATGTTPTGTTSPSATTAALTPLPATPSSYIQPPTPILGGLLQSTYGEFEPWTGGRPLYHRSGLDTTWVTKSKLPNQLCPTSSSGAQKSYNYRQKGLKTSFNRGSDLSVFQTALLKKLQDTGLDTITYMPHPKDPKDMVSVLQYYASFTLDTVREHAKRLVPLYDQYDGNHVSP